MLSYPAFSQEFEVYTDASAHQLGGVIMQKGRTLAFWCRKCTEAQKHHTMNKEELMSILEMLCESRSILWGRRSKIFTDHKNLVQQTFNNPQNASMELEIEEFGPEIVYIRRHENVVADALSRFPLHEEDPTTQLPSAGQLRLPKSHPCIRFRSLISQ